MKEFTSKEAMELLGKESKTFMSFIRRKVRGVDKPTKRMVRNKYGLFEGIVPIYHYDTLDTIACVQISMSRLNYLHDTGVKQRAVEAHKKIIRQLKRILDA